MRRLTPITQNVKCKSLKCTVSIASVAAEAINLASYWIEEPASMVQSHPVLTTVDGTDWLILLSNMGIRN